MSKGLTLIEIIVGVAIISIGAVFIVALFPSGMQMVGVNQQNDIALFLATSKMEELISLPYDEVEEGVFLEDFGTIEGFETYKREVEIRCFDPEREECQEDTGMKKIKVRSSSKMAITRGVLLTGLISER